PVPDYVLQSGARFETLRNKDGLDLQVIEFWPPGTGPEIEDGLEASGVEGRGHGSASSTGSGRGSRRAGSSRRARKKKQQEPKLQARGIVLAVHGIGRHFCYDFLKYVKFRSHTTGFRTAEFQEPTYEGSWLQGLNAQGYAVIGIDMQGYGLSEGKARNYFERFEDLVDDLLLLRKSLTHRYPEMPITVMGLSFGATLGALLVEQDKDFVYRGLICISPMLSLVSVKSNPLHCVLLPVAGVLSEWAPFMRLPELTLHPDGRMAAHYLDDPLTEHYDSVRLRVGYELMRAVEKARADIPSLRAPLFAAHAVNDTLCDIEGSEFLISNASSRRKVLHRLQSSNLYHILPNEPGNELLLDEIVDFLYACHRATGAELGTFTSPQGIPLCSYRLRAEGKPKGIVLGVHGVSSHVLYDFLRFTSHPPSTTEWPGYEDIEFHEPRYQGSWVEAINKAGLEFCGVDLQGYGLSHGKARNYFDSFDDLVQDLIAFRKHLSESNPGLPIFLLGLSMGGCLAVRVNQDDADFSYAGTVLLAPMLSLEQLKSKLINRLLLPLSDVASKLVPQARLAQKEQHPIAAMHEHFTSDPITESNAFVRVRVANQCLAAIENAQAKIAEVRSPILAFHAKFDTMCDVEGSRFCVEHASSKDKTFHEIPSEHMWHNLVNEPGNEAILAKLLP
ncbi:Monoglyceride lipase (MGL) (Monoacylglycerol lipase) (MAGL), partial [Durusdinium trenchii]